jgi:lipoprotein-anchoring transpeptidase ErfK/SrfK
MNRCVARSVAFAALASAVGALTAASPRAAEIPKRFPAAGELVVPATRVHAQPSASSKAVRTLRQLRPDFQLQTLLAIEGRFGRDGKLWYKLSLPGRPNGQRGWIRADRMNAHPVENRILVFRGARTIQVRRISDRKILLRSVVAVGKPSAPTPLGRNFYITQGFVPDDPFYGPFALATSAYSSLTDWPGGGVAGIHGTSRPDLLGQAVSHGCIRVRNDIALRLKRLAPPGTPLDVFR